MFPGQPSNDALRADVQAAARRGIDRREIVERFRGSASQAIIYRWIANERERMAALPPIDVAPPPHIVVSLPAAGTIPYLERLQSNLAQLDALMAVAQRDGQIRNTRLALEVTKEIGVQLSRAARINAEIQDIEASRRFLRSLAEIIHEEAPDVRDRIVAKMRAAGAAGDVM